jgi:RNA polymerase subunit RPABC4/transcription elongation factor Spt4
MKRIKITDAHRKRAEGTPADLQSCPVCGDDVVIHDWIDIDDDGKIVACERSGATSQANFEAIFDHQPMIDARTPSQVAAGMSPR